MEAACFMPYSIKFSQIHSSLPMLSESSCSNGVTVIKPLKPPTNQKQPIYLFFFSDSDFRPAHYQSVWPSSLPPSQNFEVTDLADLTNLVAC